MFFEPSDTNLVDIYRCRGCSKVYHRQLGSVHMSCAVAHGPGSCCHYGEKEVTDQQVADIKKLLGFTVPQHNRDGSTTLEITTDPNGNANIITTTDDPGYHHAGSDF